MSDLLKPRSASAAHEPHVVDDSEMARLRRLLLGKDYEQLTAMRADVERLLALTDDLNDTTKQTSRVAEVLSEAVLLREHQDQGVSKALRPAIADSIKASVRKDPQPLVDAIFPVIGPAVRRAVNEAIAGMLQLFDKLLEHSFSWRALKWRFEAWRTNRPYAEVVLLHTLSYWVQQVFLIHRETGLLLQHVTARQGGVRDPELIGSMLTAITDFVSDSFAVSEGNPMQSMQVGDHTVMLEQERLAIIAVVTRGHPPAELAITLQETLETIHLLYQEQLEQFDGEAAPFVETRDLLEDCLKSQTRPEAERRPWIAFLLLSLLLLGPAGYFWYQSHQRHRVWSTALDRLRAEPGMVIIDAGQDGDLYRVEGLRDPLARDPREVIGPKAQTELQWDWRWKPYLSVEEDLLVARARRALQPPETVNLSVSGDLLALSGEAPQPWADTMRETVLRIPGIAAYRDDDLRPIDDSARDREALADDRKALAARHAELTLYREQIKATILYFGVGVTSVQADQVHDMDSLAATMKALEAVADELGLVPRYLVTGYADGTGTRNENLRLSLLRARAVIERLVARGASENLFFPIKMGINPPAKASDRPEDRARSRRVTLDVIVPNGAQAPQPDHVDQGNTSATDSSNIDRAEWSYRSRGQA